MTSQTPSSKTQLATSLQSVVYGVSLRMLSQTPTMPGEYVYAVFRMHCPPDNTRVREGIGGICFSHVCILGSIPQLGSWDLEHSVNAVPSENFSKWEARVLIPVVSTFEWNWITTNNKKTKVLLWDPCRRSTAIGNIGGTIHTAWGRPAQAFRSDTCDVTLSVDYHCHAGQRLVISGAAPSLGSWDPQKGVIAREEFPPGSGRWTANLILEKVHRYEWKWVVTDARSGRALRWENGSNRYLYVDYGDDGLHLEAPWEASCFRHTQDFRFLPEVAKDDLHILSAVENARATDENQGRLMLELHDPRGHVSGEKRKDRTKSGCSNRRLKKTMAIYKKTKPSQDITMTTSVMDTVKKGYSFFGWITGVVSSFLDLLE